jgi:hypothetical protein
MPFDPTAPSKPFISVEGPDKPSSARRAIESAPARDEFAIELESMRREETSLFCAIRELRVESERLIEWCKGMGQNTGSPLWGLHQQNYSDNLRIALRAKADKLKSEVGMKFPGDAGRRLLDGIFATPGRYDAQVTVATREELGL